MIKSGDKASIQSISKTFESKFVISFDCHSRHKAIHYRFFALISNCCNINCLEQDQDITMEFVAGAGWPTTEIGLAADGDVPSLISGLTLFEAVTGSVPLTSGNVSNVAITIQQIGDAVITGSAGSGTLYVTMANTQLN